MAAGAEQFLARAAHDQGPWAVVGLAAGIAAWFSGDSLWQWLSAIALGLGLAFAAAAALRGDRRVRHITSREYFAQALRSGRFHLDKAYDQVGAAGKVGTQARLEGRNTTMVIAPEKKATPTRHGARAASADPAPAGESPAAEPDPA